MWLFGSDFLDEISQRILLYLNLETFCFPCHSIDVPIIEIGEPQIMIQLPEEIQHSDANVLIEPSINSLRVGFVHASDVVYMCVPHVDWFLLVAYMWL